MGGFSFCYKMMVCWYASIMVCWVYLLELPLLGVLMSTYNIHLCDQIGNNPKISLNIGFLKLLEEFPRD